MTDDGGDDIKKSDQTVGRPILTGNYNLPTLKS